MEDIEPSRLLTLLETYVSEETKKARRNTLFISFVIVSIYFLGLSISDLKVFGLSLDQGNEVILILLALVLSTFWFVLYLIFYFRDKSIDKERKHALSNEIEINNQRLEALALERKEQEDAGIQFVNNEHKRRSEFFDLYSAYLERTKEATTLNRLVTWIEHWLPIILFASSTVILGAGANEKFTPNKALQSDVPKLAPLTLGRR